MWYRRIYKDRRKKNCYTEEQLLDKAKKIIIKNPLKPLNKIQEELHLNDIFLKDDKVYRIITKLRNNNYPKDEDYLSQINNIRITYDEKIPNSKNLFFCHINFKFINPEKNRFEQYIIFTSILNLKFLTKATNIFIDATFKVAPKSFYQLLNILVHIEKESFTIPIIHVLMSNKSLLSYRKILNDIKILAENYNIDWEPNNIKFVCDFEKSLIKAVNLEFPKSKINGCFFHYVKALWKKAKIFGLTKLNLLKRTKIIIFGFKIYPFILKKNKENIITKSRIKMIIKFFRNNKKKI